MDQKLNSLKIIHLAMCGGVVFLYIFIGELHTLEFLELPAIDMLALVYLFIPLISIFLSNYLYTSQLKQLSEGAPQEERVTIYQTAKIIQWAILEGGAFILLFLKPELLVFGFISIVYMITSFPSRQRMEQSLDILGK